MQEHTDAHTKTRFQNHPVNPILLQNYLDLAPNQEYLDIEVVQVIQIILESDGKHAAAAPKAAQCI